MKQIKPSLLSKILKYLQNHVDNQNGKENFEINNEEEN